MACCGRSASSAAASMQRTADGGRVSSIAGLTAEEPVLLGEPDNTLYRVQVTRAGIHSLLRAGQAAWVGGSGVAPLLEDGSLIDLAGRRLASRVWRVGVHNYLDYQQAQDASAATGLPIVEVN